MHIEERDPIGLIPGGERFAGPRVPILPQGLEWLVGHQSCQPERPSTFADLAAHDVTIRLLGDIAIIHARTTYTTADGHPASGRYTDIWARRHGHWLAISAHVTRS